MKKLTIEDRIERLEDLLLGRLCHTCFREMDHFTPGWECWRCKNGELESDGE